MMPAVAGWLALWALYLIVLGSLRPGDVVAGAVVAAAVRAACGRFLAGTRLEGAGRAQARVHWRAVPARGAATAVDIVRGTVDVARAVLAPVPRTAPGTVEIPLPETSAAGVTVLALALTLSPGSVLVDVARRRRVMLMHVLDARDPERVRARFVEFDRRWRRPAVE
jgi:multisubunit Na+/H+ antiporter MnhE subunit